MSRETSELSTIENLFEIRIEQLAAMLGLRNLEEILSFPGGVDSKKIYDYLIQNAWKAAEDEFAEKGGYE